MPSADSHEYQALLATLHFQREHILKALTASRP